MYLGMDFSTVFFKNSLFYSHYKVFFLFILHNIIYVLKEHNTV